MIVRCCQCKRITDQTTTPAARVGRRGAETLRPCYVCTTEAQVIREKAAAIRAARVAQAVPA